MSNDSKDGGPAFPPFHNPQNHDSGMTLRDWFAGQALAGLISHYGTPEGAEINEGPRRAYILADAMLAERSK